MNTSSQSSVRNGFTGKLLLLNKFGIAVSVNPKRTATGSPDFSIVFLSYPQYIDLLLISVFASPRRVTQGAFFRYICICLSAKKRIVQELQVLL